MEEEVVEPAVVSRKCCSGCSMDRTIMQMISPLVERGNAVFYWGSASFAFFCSFSLLGVVVWSKFSGVNFCFWGSVLVLVAFCLGFCFMLWRFAPETVLQKFSSRQVFFFGFVLVDVIFAFVGFFFVRKRDQVATPPHCAFLVCSFSSFCPAAVVLSPILAVRPFSCRGPFWAPRVFWILLEPVGLTRLARSRLLKPFSDARRQGCFCTSRLCFAHSVNCVCSCTLFLVGTSSAGAIDAPFSGMISASFCLPESHKNALRPGPSLEKRGRVLPPKVPFSHARFCSRPR